MSFLTPLFLLGLLAGLIPLAIHFIRREKPPQIVFSTLRFFKKTTRKQFLFQRIQQLLLLLLRAGVLALLAFAFARPFFNQAMSRWVDVAPKAVVILIDRSMSMAYPDYFDDAKTAALDILNDLNPGDEAALITFADTTEQVRGLTPDTDSLKQAINELAPPGQQLTRFFPAIRMADEILKESKYDEKIIHLVSDFQAEGMTEFDSQWKLQPGVAFATVDVARDETRNLAVTGVKSPAQIRSGAQQQTLYARVRSLGSVRQNKSTVVVKIDDKEQLRQGVDLSGQSEVVVNLPVQFEGEGSHTGQVSIVEDEFQADDNFYFTVDVLPKIKVLVVNGEASNNWYDDEGHWFDLAVQSTDQSPFALVAIQPDQVNATRLRGQDVVVLLNVGRLQSSQAAALVSYVEEGGSLLLAPGDRVVARDFNRQLGVVSPATLVDVTATRRDDYLVIADMELRHPILQALKLDWNARFEGNWSVKPQDDAEVVMSFDDGEPALVERQVDKGRSLLFASSLDLEWNNLPLQGMYLPFVHEMLKHLAQTPDKESSYLVGDRVALLPGLNQLQDPQGETLSLSEGAPSLLLAKTGIYRAANAQQVIYYAVNSPVAESDLRAMEPSDLLDQILNPETKPTQSAEVRSQLLSKELERPQRLWWWILAAVALLLIAESFVSNRTYR